MHIETQHGPGYKIFSSGGNGRIKLSCESDSENEQEFSGVGDVSFESSCGQEFDTLGITKIENPYHLHVIAFLVKYLQQSDRFKVIQKRLKTIFRSERIFSIEAKVALQN